MNPQKYLSSRLLIILIVILSIVAPFSTDMYLPGLPIIVEYFGTTDAILNMTLYGFMMFMAIGILILGPISDKYGRKPILITSLIAYTIISTLCAFSPNIWAFIMLRIFQGVAAGGMLVISTALIKDCFEASIRDRILTLTVVMGVVGPLMSPIVGAYLIDAISWQSTLIAPAFLTAASVIVSFFFTESLPENERFTGSVLGVILHQLTLCKNRAFTLFLLSTSVLKLPFMAFLAVSSYIFIAGYGISGSLYSIFLAIDIIIGTAGMLVIQQIGYRIGGRRTGPIFIALGFLSGILMLTFGHAGAYICLLCFIPCGISAIGVRPYTISNLLKQYDGDTGSVSSLFNFTVMFIGCTGMIIGTLPWPDYITGLGTCSVCASIASAILWLILVKSGMKLRGMD